MEQIDIFEDLKKGIRACRICEEKFGYEPHPIFFGNQDSPIMQISQAPSISVHKTGKPFNDLSGKKLRQEWYQISDEVFYDPKNFYITSAGHCFPGKTPSGGDRLPPRICSKTWLEREMKMVDNQIYMIVGGKAAEILFPKENFTSLVFQNRTINGKPAYILPHPSPLNVKWFKDNPAFLEERVFEVRKAVHDALKL